MKRILDKYFSNALLDNITYLLLPYNLKLLSKNDGEYIKIYFKPRHWKEEDAPHISSFRKEEAVKLLCDWENTRKAINDMIKQFQKDYKY